jgi:hypothetical protein
MMKERAILFFAHKVLYYIVIAYIILKIFTEINFKKTFIRELLCKMMKERAILIESCVDDQKLA